MWHTTLDLPDELRTRYEQLAEKTGQQTKKVLQEALETYLAQIAEEDLRVQAAMAAADRGETVDAEEVHAEAEALIAHLAVSPEQRAQIRAEVRGEMEQAYGVALCG